MANLPLYSAVAFTLRALEVAGIAPTKRASAGPNLLLDSMPLVAGRYAVLANVSPLFRVFRSVAIETPEEDLSIKRGPSCQTLCAFSIFKNLSHFGM